MALTQAELAGLLLFLGVVIGLGVIAWIIAKARSRHPPPDPDEDR